MGLAGALAGVGQGVGQLGQMAMQGALAKRQLDQNSKWIEAGMFRKVVPRILGSNLLDDYSVYGQQMADPAAQPGAPAPMQAPGRPITQVARMLPDDPAQMGSAALLAKRF